MGQHSTGNTAVEVDMEPIMAPAMEMEILDMAVTIQTRDTAIQTIMEETHTMVTIPATIPATTMEAAMEPTTEIMDNMVTLLK